MQVNFSLFVFHFTLRRVPRLSFNPPRHDFLPSQHPFYPIQKLPNFSNSVLGQFFPPPCLNLPVCCGSPDLYCCPGFLQLLSEKLFTATKVFLRIGVPSRYFCSINVFFGSTTCFSMTNDSSLWVSESLLLKSSVVTVLPKVSLLRT